MAELILSEWQEASGVIKVITEASVVLPESRRVLDVISFHKQGKRGDIVVFINLTVESTLATYNRDAIPVQYEPDVERMKVRFQKAVDKY